MLENKRETVINDKTYSILLPSVINAIPLCTRTVALLAPVLADGLGAASVGGVEGLRQKIATILGPALVSMTAALGKVDSAQVDGLMMDAVRLSHLSCSGAPISGASDFEKHFSANRQDVFQAMGWTLMECVRDFFPKLEGQAFQIFREEMEGALQSPKGGPRYTGSVAPAGRASVHGVNLNPVESASGD